MKRIFNFIKFIVPALVLVVAVSIVYGLFVEPSWYETTRHTVHMENFPKNVQPLNVVQMADFHRGPYVSEGYIEKTVATVNEMKPDLIVLTGDFVSEDKEYAESVAKVLAGLRAPLGVYAVLGNHDNFCGPKEVRKRLKAVGIKVLYNQNVKIAGGLWLVGIEDQGNGRPNVKKAFAGVPWGALPVVITHSPRIVDEFPDRKCLVFAAHTHGGQIDIPGWPRNRLPRLKGWKYIDGWYDVGNVKMYVNRGLGVYTPPFRFRCRPEISFFTISGTSG